MKKLTILLLAVLMILSLCACGQSGSISAESAETTWQEQYDMGIKYLDEGNYEEAIVAFTAAIEIDPKQAEVYMSLADAYIGQGDPDAAQKALTDGLSACGENAELQAKLDELTSPEEASAKNQEDSAEGTPAEVSGTLKLSNVTCRYEAGGPMAEKNEGAAGGMTLSFTVSGPSNVRAVLIASWKDSWTEEEAASKSADMATVWKDQVTPDPDRVPPFSSGVRHPVGVEELGTTKQVLLVGLDSNGDVAGYAIVTESIPE